MKITLSLAVLALAASQAMAVVPIPIAGCTKKVVVLPTDTGCADFAAKNGCTFEDLLKWNLKLRTDCANLDVGAPLCVSVTPGAGGETPGTGGEPAPAKPSSPAAHSPVAPASSAHATAKATATATKSGAAPVATTSGNSSVVPPTAARVNGAAADKTSMVLSVAGVLVSVAYML